jgi:hypothetical protein
VRTNTRVKLSFSVPEPEELKTLSFLSGETIVEMSSRSVSKSMESTFGERTETIAFQERFHPRLTPQDIQRHSDNPLEFITHVSRGSGLSQFGGLPIAVRALRPMSRHKYEAITALPWPDGPMIAPVNVPPSPVSATATAKPIIPPSPAATPPSAPNPAGAAPSAAPGTPPASNAAPSPAPPKRPTRKQQGPRTPAARDAEIRANALAFEKVIWEGVQMSGFFELREIAPPTNEEILRNVFDELA